MTISKALSPILFSALCGAPIAHAKPILKATKIEELSHKSKYRFSMTTQRTRRGTKAQRFEIRHGDCGKSSGWSDCKTDRGRIERKEKPKNKMVKPNGTVWYGYSIYIPKDFVSLGRANTILSQAKVEKHGHPLWAMTFNDKPYLLYGNGKHCALGSLSGWRGKWNDITVYANYATSGQKTYFQLFKNGKKLCQFNEPMMPKKFAKQSQKIGLKYGIYSSFVSRYLSANATKPVNLETYTQKHATGSTSKSATPTPFKYDWGVKLPTHVIYYDEMRYGKTRADVDVRMREAAGERPVD
jgi:hypothetical protein